MERFGHYLLGLFAAVLLVSSNAAHARRVAIIIANETYASEARLSNPVRDARAIAAALGPQGAKFDEVRLLIDLDQKGMKRAILAIADHTGADALVVYFSGHGIRDEHRRNFLLPVEAVINRPGDIAVEGVDAEDLILAVKKAQPKLGLIVLDACRNNPFTAAMGTRSATKGLMRYGGEGLNGVLVAYATEGGQVADDGRAGTGSPFAIAFARHIATPGTPLLALLDQIGDDVAAFTGGKQTPTRDGNMRANAMLIPAVLNRP
ncbi:caspase family protein, partial [Sandarakinorhabdus sp.]|uniref:caspase family protein n=1 Tax=Sandarakinorhabdus sp. TaxID=1916663 RepID=UPI003341FA97